jgi:fatty-acyl-CoA synthase
MNSTPFTNYSTLTDMDLGLRTKSSEAVTQENTFAQSHSGYRKLSGSISHKKIINEAKSLARRLLGLGPRHQARVALIVDKHLDFVRYYMACRYAGLVPISLPAIYQTDDLPEDVLRLHRGLVKSKAEIAIASTAQLPLLMKAADGLNLSFYGGTGAFIHLPEADVMLHPAQNRIQQPSAKLAA